MSADVAAQNVTVAVLAGGRGSRLGGVDKGLLPVAGQRAVERVLESIPGNLPRVIVANRNLPVYRRLGVPVWKDPYPDFQGPLAGMLAALHASKTPWVQILPCDGLALPRYMTATLLREATDAQAPAAFPLYCAYGQYTCSILSRDLTGPLQQALANGERRLGKWLASVGTVPVKFDAVDSSPIWSVNTPEEWRAACETLRREPAVQSVSTHVEARHS
jgi:molybdopterin-guanine dinucleotide biosynthesis protein A